MSQRQGKVLLGFEFYCRNANSCTATQDAAAVAMNKSSKQHQQPTAVREKQPDTLYHAYSAEHTLQVYPDRYHPLSNLLQPSSRSETAVLQPMHVAEQADSSILPGVAILIREYPELQPCLEKHPSGKYVLSEAAMQRVPQSGDAWQLLRLQCVTASSCHIFLGFHEAAASNIFITAKQRKRSDLEEATQQLLSKTSVSGLHASSMGSQKAFLDWGHEHEANAVETFL